MTIATSENEDSDMGQASSAQAAGAPRRRPGRPSLSNEALLDKALDLFLENGFAGTSIDAITAAAGMAKRTVYARYGDKTQLFKAALARAIDDWIIPIEQLRALEEDDLQRTLIRISDVLIANVLSPGGLRLMRLTNAESVRMPEISSENVRRGTAPTLAYLADLFERRMNLSPTLSEPASAAFLNLIVSGPANAAAWGVQLAVEDVEQQTRFGVQIFLHGLALRSDQRGERLRELIEQAGVCLDQARERLRG